jgi:hypothetical protein
MYAHDAGLGSSKAALVNRLCVWSSLGVMSGPSAFLFIMTSLHSSTTVPVLDGACTMRRELRLVQMAKTGCQL